LNEEDLHIKVPKKLISKTKLNSNNESKTKLRPLKVTQSKNTGDGGKECEDYVDNYNSEFMLVEKDILKTHKFFIEKSIHKLSSNKSTSQPDDHNTFENKILSLPPIKFASKKPIIRQNKRKTLNSVTPYKCKRDEKTFVITDKPLPESNSFIDPNMDLLFHKKFKKQYWTNKDEVEYYSSMANIDTKEHCTQRLNHDKRSKSVKKVDSTKRVKKIIFHLKAFNQ